MPGDNDAGVICTGGGVGTSEAMHSAVGWWEQAAALRHQGMSLKEIGRRFGITKQAVSFALVQMGMSRAALVAAGVPVPKQGRRGGPSHLDAPTVKSKRCNKCCQEKPADQFHRNHQSGSGLTSACKSCRNNIAVRRRAHA